MKIDVLGTKYSIEYKSRKQDKALADLSGYCDFTTKSIVLLKIEEDNTDPLQVGKLQTVYDATLRHEIVHALLYESGLAGEVHWVCEEMVDWVALQLPKLNKIFDKIGM